QELWTNFVNEARLSYLNIFEKYWRESSYFKSDSVTGNKLQGFNASTKTYGSVAMPWPEAPREGATPAFTAFSAAATEPRGVGEPIDEANQLYYPRTNANDKTYNHPLVDGVWTPGESWNDANGNGMWYQGAPAVPAVPAGPDGPVTPAEDFWRSSNTSALRTDACGIQLPNAMQRTTAATVWDPKRGEIFADYNNTVDLINGVVGYDPSVGVWVADVANRTNTLNTVNELNLDPTCPADLSGDFSHTVVYGDPLVTANVNVPANGWLDYAVDANFRPLIYPAMLGNTATPATISYSQWQTNGVVYGGTAPAPADAVLVTVKVNLYQSAELFNSLLLSASGGKVNIYGDPVGGDGVWTPAIPGTPGTPAVPAVPAVPSELFEDFISWWDPTGPDKDGEPNGGYTYVPVSELQQAPWYTNNPSATNRPDRTVPLTWQQYTNYIAWNYPGNATGLIARAGNGWYDGPDAWKRSGVSTKYIQRGYLDPNVAITLDPDWDGQWDTRFFGGSWTGWWKAAFGVSTAPDWQFEIPNVTPFTPAAGSANGWIPADDWGYNGPRNFCDLASAMYHLGGDFNNATNILAPATPFTGFHWGMVRPVGAEAIIRPAGDGLIGEITSPWNESIYGQDIGNGPLSADQDQMIVSAGPFAFDVNGINGFDAGNLLTLESMTRQYQPPNDPLNPHPVYMNTNRFRFYRDCNLDGLINNGESRTGDANYAQGFTGGTFAAGNPRNYPFNIFRYLEDAIACWDYAEDFTTLVTGLSGDPDNSLWAAVIFPVSTNSGNAALGQTAGRKQRVLTRDRSTGFNIGFQVRPVGGDAGGEGPSATNSVSSDYCMNLMAHEGGHDWFGWPDLYDYNVWNVPGMFKNAPVAGYDLMSGGGMVHGTATLKEDNLWIHPENLSTLLTKDGGPMVVQMKPVNVYSNGYYRFDNPARPGESFYLWYVDTNTSFGVVGGRGLYIEHVDKNGYAPGAIPPQQRQNTHFVYEMLQADGLNQLQDNVNYGDTGDPFPGTSNRTTWLAGGYPNNRWWDQTDSGLRILNVQLPSIPGYPALVTFEYYDPATPISPTLDTDGDGMPDWWEIKYGLNPYDPTDATLDPDLDGLSNLYEYVFGTDPQNPDTGNTGTPDGQRDSNTNGLSNYDEQQITKTKAFRVLAGVAGSPGSADGVIGSAARFNLPEGVAVDTAGIVYVADSGNHTIRMVTVAGRVTTLAGQAGVSGITDSLGNAARFNHPAGVAVDAAGIVYVADRDNHTIRKITPVVGSAWGTVTTLAGYPQMFGVNDGTSGFARFNHPTGVAVDSANNVYVADSGNHTIRKVTPAGVVTTLAGSAGAAGSPDSAGSAAQFNTPAGVTVDSAGTLYVADHNNHTIRMVTPAGLVTTIAGKAGTWGSTDVNFGMLFKYPHGVTVNSSGIVLVADTGNNRIAIDPPGSQTARINGWAVPPNGGTVIGAGRYPVGSAVQLRAEAYLNYFFAGWSDGNPNPTRTITVPGTNITYIANFAPTAYTYTAPPQNLLLPANGGQLVSYSSQLAATTYGAARLTDGVQNGMGASWCSAANPGTQTFVYAFTNNGYATLSQAVLWNYGWGVYYSKDVEVWTSPNGTNYTLAATNTLPA
ncbi:MAG: hypothetical protein NTV49_06635, partial [Kiritimatiellaeota bacterium]|nr:hypothetical protein [Kiritimatiellota bacterium]